MTGAGLICLALTIYFEARSEPIDAQVAVAQVVLNRVAHEAFPDTVCGVVEQGSPEGDSLPVRYSCQFSWRCDGKSDRPRNQEAWLQSLVLAQWVSEGMVASPAVGKATYYHAEWVTPSWRVAFNPVAQVGTHIFYEGETE